MTRRLTLSCTTSTVLLTSWSNTIRYPITNACPARGGRFFCCCRGGVARCRGVRVNRCNRCNRCNKCNRCNRCNRCNKCNRSTSLCFITLIAPISPMKPIAPILRYATFPLLITLLLLTTLYIYPSAGFCWRSLISSHNAQKNGRLTRKLDSRL